MLTKAVSKQEIEGLNSLLSDIFHRDVRLSFILRELGCSEQQVEIVKERYLQQIVVLVQETLKEFIFSRADGERIWHILSERYGLNGERIKTLQKLGAELGISQERVRQLEKRGIRKLSLPRRKRILLERLQAGVLEWFNCLAKPQPDAITQILRVKGPGKKIVQNPPNMLRGHARNSLMLINPGPTRNKNSWRFYSIREKHVSNWPCCCKETRVQFHPG